MIKEEVTCEPILKHNLRKIVPKKPQESPTPTKSPKHGRRKSVPTKPPKLVGQTDRKLYCQLCNIKFKNKRHIDEHRRTAHKDGDNWVCEICGKIFINRATLYSHVKSHSDPQFACDQCDYKTWHKHSLVKHIRIHSVFLNRATLYSHVKSHSDPQFECDQCDYKTWHKHSLVKHIRIHSGIKLYQCKHCTASFYNNCNLRAHDRRNHIKERNFECNICRRTFFGRTSFMLHMDSHNNIRRYECEVCHSRFTRRDYWKKHLHDQHSIDIAPCKRPGRRQTNAVFDKDVTERMNLELKPRIPEKSFDKIYNEAISLNNEV